MTKRTLCRRLGLVLPAVAAIVLLAAACEELQDENEVDPGDPIGTPALPDTPAPETPLPTPAPGHPTPEPAEPAVTALHGEIVDIDGRGVSGEVLLTSLNGETEITVDLDGLEFRTHTHAIHQGSCAAEGDVAYPLVELEVGPDGSAGATDVVDVALLDLSLGFYYAVHDLSEPNGAAVACADFEASAGEDGQG